jgi:ferritin
MLAPEMVERLNKQINLELLSSNMYLQMASWCAYKGLDGCAAFLNQHAGEERLHMDKLVDYLTKTGALVRLGALDAPPQEFESVAVMFQKILDHERYVTSKINDLAQFANTLPDFSTLQFLQWYIAEQHEEEHLFSSICDKVKLLGTDKQGLYFLDKEIASLVTAGGGSAAGTGVSAAPA